MIAKIATVALLLAPAAALAAPTPPAAAEKLVCKTRVETGSRLAKREECRTPEQWARLGREPGAIPASFGSNMTSGALGGRP